MSQDILRQRAERLATTTETRFERFEDLIVFRVGAEEYAVRLEAVRGVVEDTVTPMPGSSGWIAGALNVRGALVSVLELSNALRLDATGEGAGKTSVVLLDSSFGVIGARVHGTPELRRVAEHEINLAVSERAGVRGVAAGTIALLDVEALLETLEAR